jgi:hypothetical protein
LYTANILPAADRRFVFNRFRAENDVTRSASWPRSFAVAAVTCLACFAGVGTALAAQQSYTTVVIQKGTATGLVAGMRTSDISASLVKYTVSGSDSTCSIENSNSSPPKNIGNVVCLPVSKAQYNTSNRCESLMNAGKGNCQSNSTSGKCPSGTTPVYPACNYRTSSSSSNAAYWVWNVGAASDGQYDVDCLQAGYRGYTSK